MDTYMACFHRFSYPYIFFNKICSLLHLPFVTYIYLSCQNDHVNGDIIIIFHFVGVLEILWLHAAIILEK